MSTADLEARLDQAADRLTTRVLAEMYADPFWRERYGDRAERHGRQDGRYHIDYLIQALQARDPSIMVNYARWLQRVLTSRGMATRHLAENFIRLATAIRDQGWPDAPAATALLDAAIAALGYADGPAAALQAAATELAASTGRADATQLEDLIGYAADALALDQPAVFASHVIWLAGFVERRGGTRGQLIEQLEVLAPLSPHLRLVIAPALAALTAG